MTKYVSFAIPIAILLAIFTGLFNLDKIVFFYNWYFNTDRIRLVCAAHSYSFKMIDSNKAEITIDGSNFTINNFSIFSVDDSYIVVIYFIENGKERWFSVVNFKLISQYFDFSIPGCSESRT